MGAGINNYEVSSIKNHQFHQKDLCFETEKRLEMDLKQLKGQDLRFGHTNGE